ncbi:hypothetical protein TGP89_358800 [Toxoplasma gondii p89]|uniref:Uncharacterized protein n=1 Tax=Toxoplasma gondii p89 TaxID=943119 RepID=A0A086JP75_TOXGO|nr:hypothetical protein TGP89_358800 [Toxoplasma gondii p89]
MHVFQSLSGGGIHSCLRCFFSCRARCNLVLFPSGALATPVACSFSDSKARHIRTQCTFTALPLPRFPLRPHFFSLHVTRCQILNSPRPFSSSLPVCLFDHTRSRKGRGFPSSAERPALRRSVACGRSVSSSRASRPEPSKKHGGRRGAAGGTGDSVRRSGRTQVRERCGACVGA